MSKPKKFDPVEAARATAQYMPADPAVWLDRAALAGMSVTGKGEWICMEWDKCDPNEATFLSCWLTLTPGGKAAVAKLIEQRAAHSV